MITAVITAACIIGFALWAAVSELKRIAKALEKLAED